MLSSTNTTNGAKAMTNAGRTTGFHQDNVGGPGSRDAMAMAPASDAPTLATTASTRRTRPGDLTADSGTPFAVSAGGC